MIDQNLSPEGEDEEQKDPTTNTDDDIGDLEIPAADIKEAIPVAESASLESEPPAPPPPPSGPRVFPQHYTILFGGVLVLVASMSVWERAHVFGVDIIGTDTISGSFLFALALYTIIVAVLNIVQGRLKGMMGAFLTGFGALYFGIRKLSATWGHEHTLGWNDIKGIIKNEAVPENLSFVKLEWLDGVDSVQTMVYYFIGQFGPGVWLSILGGFALVSVFLKALFGGGGAKKQPAPSSRRRRR